MYILNLCYALIYLLSIYLLSYLFFLLILKTQNYWLGGPVTPVLRGCGIKTGRSKSKLDSCFILDVNVMDGTLMAPSTPFTKIWRMRNSGTLAWPRGTHLVWVGGDKFSDRVSVEVEVGMFNLLYFSIISGSFLCFHCTLYQLKYFSAYCMCFFFFF